MISTIIRFIAEAIFDKSICDTSRESLLCQKPNYLTIDDSGKIMDLYYIKNGFVHSAIAKFYNEKKTSYHYFRKQYLIPKSYFEIAEYLQLEVDKETYISIVVTWMENMVNTVFYDKISRKDLPDSIPSEWGNIEDEILNLYKEYWSSSPRKLYRNRIYADFFSINKHGCLITGYGKTKACRMIANEDYVLDLVIVENMENNTVRSSRGIFGGTEKQETIHYCVHMLSPEETKTDQITEVSLSQYIRYAEGNIKYCGCSAGEFYNMFITSDIKYILVPYCDTVEEKAEMIKNYLKKGNVK